MVEGKSLDTESNLTTSPLSATPVFELLSLGGNDEETSLSPDIHDLLAAIGKDTVLNHTDLLHIYNYMGKAFWLTVVAEQFRLNMGTARALVFLMKRLE
jgi:hypothetical protein